MHLFGGRGTPPVKTYNAPKRLPNCVLLNLFFGRDNEIQIYHGNFLLMENKHMKLFVTKRSTGAYLSKMHQNTFGPARGASMRSPDPLAETGAYF